MNLGKFNSVSYDFRMIIAVNSKVRRFILDFLRCKMGEVVGSQVGPCHLGTWAGGSGLQVTRTQAVQHRDRPRPALSWRQPSHQRRLEAALLMMPQDPHGQSVHKLSVCPLTKADSLLGWAVGGSAWPIGQGTWLLSSAQLW